MKITKWLSALTISLSIIFLLVSAQNYRKCESILENKQEAILDVTERIDIISKQNTEYREQIDNLTHQIKVLQQDQRKLRDRTDFLNRGGERPIKRNMNVSAYWKGSCGKNPGDPTYGITASGKTVQVGMIAAGPELDTGTKIYIPYFNRVFTVEDRGGAITNGHLDIYMETAAECFEFGRVPEMEVYILCN